MIPPQLLRLLACPLCRKSLEGIGDAMQCRCCNESYPIMDGIPVLLPKGEQRGEGEAADRKRRQAEFFAQEDSEFETTRPHGQPALYGWALAEKFRRSIEGLGGCVRGATALTVCGGSGMDAEFLARAGARVISSDLSLGAAQRARERARRFGLDLLPIVADAERLPFVDRSVPLVYVHDGLHHLDDPYAGVTEMIRVAAVAVSITEPADAALTALAVRAGWALSEEEAGNLVGRMDLDRLSGVLRSQGLEVVHAERYGLRYGHEPGQVMHLLSRRALFPLATSALVAANRLGGSAGNKLTVQGRRDDALSRTAGTALP